MLSAPFYLNYIRCVSVCVRACACACACVFVCCGAFVPALVFVVFDASQLCRNYEFGLSRAERAVDDSSQPPQAVLC